MKRLWIKTALLILPALLLAACIVTPFQDSDSAFGESYPSQFIVGDVYVLRKYEKIDGNIAGIGTTLIIEEGALVMGDISLVGSNLEISGYVAGDVNVFAGTSIIRDTAVVTGSINQIFHQVKIEPDAVVRGEINRFVFPTPASGNTGEKIVNVIEWLQPSRLLAFYIGRIAALVFATFLATSLFKTSTKRVSAAIRHSPAAAWGAGIISMIAVPIISLILLVTICLSPVGIVLILVFLLSTLWGWVALSLIGGEKLTQWLKLDWGVESTAVFGALIVGVLSVLISLIPCIGFLVNQVISAFGLGGVLLSQFGRITE